MPTPDKFSTGYRPSDAMLSEVGLDFDGDLLGLHKGLPPTPRAELSCWWRWGAYSVPFLVLLADLKYGLGLVTGMALSAMWNLLPAPKTTHDHQIQYDCGYKKNLNYVLSGLKHPPSPSKRPPT